DAVSGRRSRQWTSLSPYQFPVDRRPECFDRRCAHRHRVKDTNESFSHGTRTTMIIRYDKLRYRLLPYSYSLAWRDASEVSAPLERIPLFVRAGSIVPFGPVAQDADDPLDPLEVRVYPGANGEFEWYPDAA